MRARVRARLNSLKRHGGVICIAGEPPTVNMVVKNFVTNTTPEMSSSGRSGLIMTDRLSLR